MKLLRFSLGFLLGMVAQQLLDKFHVRFLVRENLDRIVSTFCGDGVVPKSDMEAEIIEDELFDPIGELPLGPDETYISWDGPGQARHFMRVDADDAIALLSELPFDYLFLPVDPECGCLQKVTRVDHCLCLCTFCTALRESLGDEIV